ncbi:MAG: methionine--tRNA ligase [Flavobacteriales bacterium]|jgi:methionyl-tRNA synthetase|nr:methionine--tRNA ligase [Flavobacteriales bacterium]HJN63513.1 methionine--tRNA ligase [Flavobacteriales bacterium]|tara:strand:+ start:7016 stop:8710 length:1695 start_codon:yes stop_codon:yes gene_type:complete
MSTKRYTVTSALPYANGPLHIGHIAGAYLPADIYVRYLRGKGHDVVFVCGSDEHGAAITLQAKKDGVSPQEIVDKYHNRNKKAFANFGIEFSVYHRTSHKLHHETAQEFFKTLEQKGVFTKKTSEQFYDEKNKQFLADRYISGECPKCNERDAYGDQCEKCGSTLSPNELINPKSTLSGNTPVKKDTTHWYLPMQDHENWLKPWIEDGILNGKNHHDAKAWRSQVIGQCKSWIDGGLQARAMTRDLEWGVKVPIKGGDGKVLYVWLDAPIGYISATKQWATDNGKNWEDYWKSEDTELVHFIGKDNIVFHCIIFPIILKSHEGYILPTNVPANEFLNLEGEKLSTSRNWAIWLDEYFEDFKGQEDAMRYVLCATAPESKDTDFTWKDFQARNNNELVAIFGNFINRVVVLINKYWEGVVPNCNTLDDYDKEVLEKLKEFPKKIGASIEKYRFREALAEFMKLARLGNKYLADTEPWKLKKTDESRTETIMNIAMQIAASLAILSEPFMPFASSKLKNILALKEVRWSDAGEITIMENHKINKAIHLFEKIEDEKIEEQRAKLKA